jgi:hypothetical protein
MAKRLHEEDDHQRALFHWIDLAKHRIKGLDLAFHPANGGKRDLREAKRLKGLGVRPGVPDVMIPWPAGGAEYEPFIWNGLAIEMKSAKGVVSAEQKQWHDRLRSAGWQVNVCRSFDEARQVIADYFGVKP